MSKRAELKNKTGFRKNSYRMYLLLLYLWLKPFCLPLLISVKIFETMLGQAEFYKLHFCNKKLTLFSTLAQGSYALENFK